MDYLVYKNGDRVAVCSYSDDSYDFLSEEERRSEGAEEATFDWLYAQTEAELKELSLVVLSESGPIAYALEADDLASKVVDWRRRRTAESEARQRALEALSDDERLELLRISDGSSLLCERGVKVEERWPPGSQLVDSPLQATLQHLKTAGLVEIWDVWRGERGSESCYAGAWLTTAGREQVCRLPDVADPGARSRPSGLAERVGPSS
jgi:hypothetical protein